MYEELNELFNGKHSMFPCSFAKASFNSKCMTFGLYNSISEEDTAQKLAQDLINFSNYLIRKNRTDHEKRFETFLAIFEDNYIKQQPFEDSFFSLLNKLHEFDKVEWLADIPRDPEDPAFAFCFNGYVWFPVTLSPYHMHKIRQANRILIAFQSITTFDINKREFTNNFNKMRKIILKHIEEVYKNEPMPLYLTKESAGKNYVQYLGNDSILIDTNYKCPLNFNLKSRSPIR